MVDLVSPALRGLRWQYAEGRIDLPTLERKIDEVLAREQRALELAEEDAKVPAPHGLIAVIRGGKRYPYVPTWPAAS
jgi:hypothetical protein